MTDCHHEHFEAIVNVARVSDVEGGPITRFAADVRISCVQCRAPFGFRGMPVGMLPGQPTTSPDAIEARMPLISPSELELLGPLAALDAEPHPSPGFVMRRYEA